MKEACVMLCGPKSVVCVVMWANVKLECVFI